MNMFFKFITRKVWRGVLVCLVVTGVSNVSFENKAYAWTSMVSCADAFSKANLGYLTSSVIGYYYFCQYNSSYGYEVSGTGCGCCPISDNCYQSSGCRNVDYSLKCTGCTCSTENVTGDCKVSTSYSCKASCCGTGYPNCGSECTGGKKCCNNKCVSGCETNCKLSGCSCVSDPPSNGTDSTGSFSYQCSGSCSAPS